MGQANSSDVVAIVALVISLAAFFTTILQVLQQYLASAEGFRRCAPSVMGLWHVGTHRKFRRHELRFEVVFETPVLFLAPPENKRGPIEKRPIYHIDGSDRSYEETNTMKPGMETVTNVSTADDEQASWVTLLAVLQRTEKDSRSWEDLNRHSARGNKFEAPKYSIITMVQKKTRSYDFMPASVTKPFATTTISHLVEMVALMGMFWKAFDDLKGNVRAEGNGLILVSTQVHSLGLMATFSKTGFSKFEKNRVIPSNDIKEYVFGCVPTILGSLKVGGLDIAKTLQTFRCSAETIEKYVERNDRGDVPSVTFELIAMLAKPVRIRGSLFKMLPNPTADTWAGESRAINWSIAMLEFQSKLDSLINNPPASSPSTGPYLAQTTEIHPLFTTIQSQWQKMKLVWKPLNNTEEGLPEGWDMGIDMREVIHDALDETGAQLLNINNTARQDLIAVVGSHVHEVLAASNVIQDEVSDSTAIPSYLARPTTAATASSRFIRVYFDQIVPKIADALIDGDVAGEDVKQKRRAIWVTLVFRMICWFLLHDFDKLDVNVMRSDMKGSRMPVFIG